MMSPTPGQQGQMPAHYEGPGSWGQHREPLPGPRPPDYRTWVIAAVIGGILFSVIAGAPAGLVALHYSRRVVRYWDSGDGQGAAGASRRARGWVIVSACSDLLGCLLVSVIIARGGTPAGWM